MIRLGPLIIAIVLATGCGRLNIGDGQLRCSTPARKCPDGYHCAADNTCWKNGRDPSISDGGADGPSCTFDVTSFDHCVMQ